MMKMLRFSLGLMRVRRKTEEDERCFGIELIGGSPMTGLSAPETPGAGDERVELRA